VSGHDGGASTPSAARAALLVLAKAPVAGLAKTRLCPPASPRAAALIAAACLLDTLDTVRSAAAEAPGTAQLLAWTGSVDAAERRHELVTALAAVTRFEQRGGSFGERIAAAHADAAARAPGAVVLQIGTDTPQVAAGELGEALALLTAARGPDAVLGPATDGGWWALGLRDPRAAAAIAAVPTSCPDTGERTLRALRDEGLTVALLDEHRDVDTAADAWAVAAGGAGPRFTAEIAAHLGAPTDVPAG
jgi:uncharacterized protein